MDGIVETAGEGVGSVQTSGVTGMEADVGTSVPRTVPAPDGAGPCLLLGPAPGDIELIHAPQWLSDLLGDGGLSWAAVDAWPDFEPVWRLSGQPGDGSEYLATQIGSEPPQPASPGGTWSNLLLNAELADSIDRCLWDEYQEAAGVCNERR